MISVVIPARNEARQIGATLARLNGHEGIETIVVDGMSDDGTAEIARGHGARVVACGPGRGAQMNRGAKISLGDTLVFLHADTILPVGFDGHVAAALCGSGVVAGAFRLRIDSRRRSLRAIAAMANRRARWLSMPYGDQALFMRRTVFERVGGFAEISIMEDFEMVRRLRRMGRIAMVAADVVTSARRWEAGGVWRTTLGNQVCVAAYMLGVSPARIVAWRGNHDASTSRTLNGRGSIRSDTDYLRIS